MRIGHGYDVHRLVEGRALILGGVEIPHPLGLDGHSDADVVTHALMDALLGAAGLGDIGLHFPDTAQEFRGICSLRLLERVMQLLKKDGWRVENADITIVAQEPKLRPHIDRMRQTLEPLVGAPVNFKATTEERLGFTGRCEAIACHAVCLLEKERDGECP